MPTITNPGVLKALVQAYIVNDRDKGKAMQEVGYAKNTATTGNCSKLFARADVKAELRRQEVELLEKNGYSVQEYQQDLKDDRALARMLKQPSAAVSATVAMGRSMGHDKDNGIGTDTSVKYTEQELKDARQVLYACEELKKERIEPKLKTGECA